MLMMRQNVNDDVKDCPAEMHWDLIRYMHTGAQQRKSTFVVAWGSCFVSSRSRVWTTLN